MQVRASAAFVGRVRELEVLERALSATQAGGGATVLLAGEAGIGKTRLASELATRAREAGFEVLLGRSLDLVGTQLAFQPLAEALRPLGGIGPGGSQRGVFEATLALLSERAAAVPVLLVLEDLHWADASTLDIVVYLAHNLDARRVLLLATLRADEPASAARLHRLADGVRRSGAGQILELGPLERAELAALLDARAGALPAAVTTAILTRSQGNPFFAEELLSAVGERDDAELPRGLRDALLTRVSGLDRRAQSLLRVAAAAGRDVSYPLLVAVTALPERGVRESLRAAVEHGVLVADQGGGRYRFRHALLAEAVYGTVLPGEREWLHARLADELACGDDAGPAELAPHWALAGRSADALTASVAAAREAQAVFGLSEARGHLERALALWDVVPDASELAGLRLDELLERTAELASQTGDAPRAVELTRQAIALVGASDRPRAAVLHERLGTYEFQCGGGDTFLVAFERAVALVPAQPPSRERARALEALAHGLALLWRYDESLALCEQALELARAVGARETELRALTTLGSDLAYLGRGDDGLAHLTQAVQLAAGDPDALHRAYVTLTDALTMLGRPRAAAQLAEEGLAALGRYEADHTVLAANWIEALLAIGEWDAADRASAAALRAVTANYPHMPLMLRADLELGRGRFDAARAHLDAARATVRHEPGLAYLDAYVAELALWQRRWTDAAEAVRDGLAWARPAWGAQIRVWLCAKGLRAQAELTSLAGARRDADAVRVERTKASALLADARRAATEAAAITPNAGGWLALAEAEHDRAEGAVRPDRWADAADAWERLERPPLTAYCRLRQAEALVAAGASRTEAGAPLRAAHAVAARLGAAPLLRELELLAARARLDPAPLPAHAPRAANALTDLGLTRREAEVLALVARGLTNREIAAELVISVKTASVHVSHILRKLDAPNRVEAAAIAHRLAPPEAQA